MVFGAEESDRVYEDAARRSERSLGSRCLLTPREELFVAVRFHRSLGSRDAAAAGKYSVINLIASPRAPSNGLRRILSALTRGLAAEKSRRTDCASYEIARENQGGSRTRDEPAQVGRDRNFSRVHEVPKSDRRIERSNLAPSVVTSARTAARINSLKRSGSARRKASRYFNAAEHFRRL